MTPELLIYADMPRWEGQLRQRRGEVSNLGTANLGLKASLQYKRAYFIDWRVCDRVKKQTLSRWDFLLDTTLPNNPKLVTGTALRTGLETTARKPFRVVPFFDPAPWGGQWMREACGLDADAPNYGGCFDCVPEENSLLLGFGEMRLEIPALDLIFHQPHQVLGEAVFGLFGHEFPIRFDFLDMVGGSSLSLQVHPLIEYIRDKFGLFYTQDESYYLLDAEPGASVYLGMKSGIDADRMFQALEDAQKGDAPFDADQFVSRWPAAKHDHFLIPAGTIHCSGAGAMVLEISATPYIFTFKLWDWGRLGLDGLCRPEELVSLLACAHRLRQQYSVPIDAAMISDVPGYTWGLVPVLAQGGVKYLSWAPNGGDHLGYARDFDNRAFYWKSPSGKDKVLVWQSPNSYYQVFEANENPLTDFMKRFGERFPNNPYDMIYERHTLHNSDNAPADKELAPFVHRWNAKYAYPHLVVATTSRMFHDFEACYGKSLPTLSGDFTGYWEYGAASSANETAANRTAAERTAQSEILWSMLNPTQYPQMRFENAWKNALLYDEHTWPLGDNASRTLIYVSTAVVQNAGLIVSGQKITGNAAPVVTRILSGLSAQTFR